MCYYSTLHDIQKVMVFSGLVRRHAKSAFMLHEQVGMAAICKVAPKCSVKDESSGCSAEHADTVDRHSAHQQSWLHYAVSFSRLY